MEWYFTLALILGGLLFALIVLRLPVFIALLGIGIIVLIGEYGWKAAAQQVPLGFAASISLQSLVPVVLFILMGEILFKAGLIEKAINAIRMGLERVPGKLAASATVAGAMLGIASGSPTASTALLGQNLIPEMQKLNYKPGLAIGSVMSAGGLSMVLPPSTVIVVLGATASIPVGPLLIAGILPGILMAVMYIVTQLIWTLGFKGDGIERERSNDLLRLPLWDRVRGLPGALLPLVLVFAVVLGVILFGIATPTEAAAFGVAISAIIALIEKKLTFRVLWESAKATMTLSGAILLLVGAAGSFSQALAASGVLSGFLRVFSALQAPTWVILVLLLLILLFLGLFLETISIILITAPFFVPVISGLGVDPIWFGVMWLIALRLGLVTPPFGMELFVMRRVAPEYSMGTIYKAALPFVFSDLVVLALIFIFPIIATGLLPAG